MCCAAKFFLEVGAYLVSRLATATMYWLDIAVAAATSDLNKENQENRIFYAVLFDDKYDGMFLIFYKIDLILAP